MVRILLEVAMMWVLKVAPLPAPVVLYTVPVGPVATPVVVVGPGYTPPVESVMPVIGPVGPLPEIDATTICAGVVGLPSVKLMVSPTAKPVPAAVSVTLVTSYWV